MVAASEHLIDLIHEAGLVPALWPEMLQKISLHVGGNGGSIMRLSNSYVSAASSPNFEQMNETFMRDGWAERDQAVKRGLALNHTGFFHDGDYSLMKRLSPTTFIEISIAPMEWDIGQQQ